MPRLRSLLMPAIATIRRGIPLSGSRYHDERRFDGIHLDRAQLNRYAAFFGFQDALPLSYLYLFAQRAQLCLMLEREFPLPVPGLVQVENLLEQSGPMSIQEAFDIEASVEMEPSTGGPVTARFSVVFLQGVGRIASCSSTYIARRSGGAGRSGTQGAQASAPPFMEEGSERWVLPGNAGWRYAGVSGDYNPIHLSRIFAKMAGFRRPIVQGWYSASRAAALLARDLPGGIRRIYTRFKKPVYLPATVELRYGHSAGGVAFIISSGEGVLLVQGAVSS
ncbi:MAG: hypothetical protein JXA20_03040 [Spirochaetes bacterium]|nr:hypothetical protein [Spirochaetota bacterium]